MDFDTLSRWAGEEVAALVKVLPADVREAAAGVPVSMEEKPGRADCDDGLQGDELGLFEGPCAMELADTADLPRIRLFLMNLWEWTDRDEQDFRDEVGTTFLHELGHYLGWDEDELGQRGLD
jgi:predicted Zn-dependent protease with MMP-like domain